MTSPSQSTITPYAGHAYRDLLSNIETISKDPNNVIARIVKNFFDAYPDTLHNEAHQPKLMMAGKRMKTRIFKLDAFKLFCLFRTMFLKRGILCNANVLELTHEDFKAKSDNENFDALKKLISNQHLGLNSISYNNGKFSSHVLGMFCWYGNVNMIRWLFEQNLCSPLDPNYTGAGSYPYVPACSHLMNSTLTSPIEKLAMLRLFPLGSLNPFITRSENTTPVFLLTTCLTEYAPVKTEVLQCLLERGMVDHAASSCVTTHDYGYPREVSLLDDFIQYVSTKIIKRKSIRYLTAIARTLIANGIFPNGNTSQKWLQSQGLDRYVTSCKRLRAYEHVAIQRRHLRPTPLQNPLKDLVCEFYGNPREVRFLNSRLCFNHTICLAQATSQKQAGEKFAWWREEFWKEDPAVRVPRFYQELALRNLQRRVLRDSCSSLLDRLESLEKQTKLEANLKAKKNVLQQMNQLFAEFESSLIPTAAAATASFVNQDRNERQRLLEIVESLKRASATAVASSSSSSNPDQRDSYAIQRYHQLLERLDELDYGHATPHLTAAGAAAAAAAASSSSSRR